MKTFRLQYSDKVKSGLKFRPLACKSCCAALQAEKYPGLSEASLTLVSDAEIRELNREYRKIDKPTDVLSFVMGDTNPDSGAVVLGDIVISAETARRQAEEYGHSVERELAFLTVHGMLHLLGYDHMSKEEEAIMFAKQEEILGSLGLLR